jgi:hypothetical protein
MASFKALNVDSESEEEIDDTKEIQLEEALKLYQTALKLHSQGPGFYDDAQDAYDELFKSEVFKYPEAISEFAHDQEDDTRHPVIRPDESETVAIIPANAADSSANSIPLLVYLSYKNKGQLAVDQARVRSPTSLQNQHQLSQYFSPAGISALRDFAEALERDDTDLDLWKKAARVAEAVSSQRISRFCLESVLAGDNDGTDQSIDLSGLDEAFAAGELRKALKLLDDDLSQSRSSDVQPKRRVLDALAKTNDPYPFLPQRQPKSEHLRSMHSPNNFAVGHISLKSTTIPSLGLEILQALELYDEGRGQLHAETLISVDRAANDPFSTPMDKDVFEDAQEQLALNNEATPSITESAENYASPEKLVQTTSNDGEGNAAQDEEVTTVAVEMTESTPIDLPTRKRSATNAGHDEPEGRVKSKRLRARESMIDAPAEEEETIHEIVHKEPWDWTVLQNADKEQIKVLDTFLSRLNMPDFGPLASVKADCQPLREEDDGSNVPAHRLLSSDLSKAIKAWTDEHSQATIYGHGTQDFVEKSTGLNLFLQHTKSAVDVETNDASTEPEDELPYFLTALRSTNSTLYETAYAWLYSIMTSGLGSANPAISSYMRAAWPDALKQTVVQLLLRVDGHLVNAVSQKYIEYLPPEHEDHNALTEKKRTALLSQTMEFVQSIFELHLDIYSSITNPSSQVKQDVRTQEADRLERWASLADEFMRLYSNTDASDISDQLVVRFLWSSTIYAGQADDVDQQHMLQCRQDLKHILQKLDIKPIALPNNVEMPHISIAAAEQEIQRLSTLDFFMSVFDNDNSDPVAVIEKLEPILELDIGRDVEGSDGPAATLDRAQHAVLDFLDSGDASLKLYLWRRLQNAYITIPYTPKVVSCLLRAIETICKELTSKRHAQLDGHQRQISMLKWLRDLDDILLRVLTKILDERNALECLDETHLRTSIAATRSLLRLLHAFAMFEDRVRFQYDVVPQFKGATSTKNFEKSRDRLREIQNRLWMLQYFLLKEAADQNPDAFPEKANDLADYLCTVHHALGQRLYCKYSNKQFIKLVRSELSSLQVTNDYSADMAQVLYDLYQMRFVNAQGDFDHGCPSETLDKKTALSLIPIVMTYALRMNVKDLIKSELRPTIEKISAASGVGKTNLSAHASYNRKVINAFLRSPIVADDLFKATRGIGSLATKPVLDDSSLKAMQGWYFLLGNITLAKYRSVKRTSPTPTDDLDAAAQYLRQDLEYDHDKWETWFRLAQIFEARIEDDLIWNSTKLNDARNEIAVAERSSIHAFTMALAVAMRSAEDDAQTRQKIAELHLEFAMRLYASSREPLNMDAFNTDKSVRHLSDNVTGVMSKVSFHRPISRYSLWHFAAQLLRKKVSETPKPWLSHYTLGKCLWKMYQSPENARARRPVRCEDVLEAFVDAVEATPKKERSSDYILEPHFKLVSTVYKMKYRGAISVQEGRDWLQATRFAQGMPLPDDGEGGTNWEKYILDILKKLSTADKQHWHHRIIARAAHVIYDDRDAYGLAGALGARHEFTQQIFTKSMTYQVWKPEHERPGRHYVYTSRYVFFFAQLLDQLRDRTNLDLLLRRVRRKSPDFIDHEKIWTTIATRYVNLLRRSAQIPEGRERIVFDATSFEDFTRNSEKLEKWALDEENTSIVLDVMRDAIELKKINNSLLKGGLIDDLIGDAYACMYEAYVAQLPPEERHPQPPALPQGTFLNMTTDSNRGDGAPNTMQSGSEAPITNGLSTSADPNARPPVQPPVGLGLSTPSHQFIGTPAVPSAVTDPARPLVEKSKPGRAKTVTRREVQRKAEAVLVKPPPIKTPTLMKRPIVEIPVYGSNAPSPVPDRDGISNSRADKEGSALSSRRGSVQSSVAGPREGSVDAGEEGDDESELSDIEEHEHEGDDDGDTITVQRKPLFPGLVPKNRAGARESDADDEDEEEEDEQGVEDEENGDEEEVGDVIEVQHDEMDVDEPEKDVEPEIPNSTGS